VLEYLYFGGIHLQKQCHFASIFYHFANALSTDVASDGVTLSQTVEQYGLSVKLPLKPEQASHQQISGDSVSDSLAFVKTN
jgi:hypothetical protein